MKLKIRVGIYILIVSIFSGASILFNSWRLLHLETPRYFVNPTFLSGTLLLYDRPMFFESREIEVQEHGMERKTKLAYNLEIPGYNSYLHRRLFRFATDEFHCGIDQAKAFRYLFCESRLKILDSKTIDNVIVNFTPHLNPSSGRTFHQSCGANE